MKNLFTHKNFLASVAIIGILLFGATKASFAQDATDPVLESVLPAEGEVLLNPNETFKLTVDAFDENLYELEVDNTLEPTLPQFTIYADETNPYGTPAAQLLFEAAGANVTYDATTQIWVIDFGVALTTLMMNNGGNDFYLVARDVSENASGDMGNITDEITFSYTLALAPPPVPLSNLPIYLGILLIGTFVVMRYRRKLA